MNNFKTYLKENFKTFKLDEVGGSGYYSSFNKEVDGCEIAIVLDFFKSGKLCEIHISILYMDVRLTNVYEKQDIKKIYSDGISGKDFFESAINELKSRVEQHCGKNPSNGTSS
ncbi:hypothetical protein [Acinetobacter sp. ANC 3882]|uniref:hypothetical protein n=1 Tax=Acinetobacter sp. ANC 3882 TaxID=2923423 RepID=UPI001F4A98D7|nr:hypothetical protein [Acinetobacter sp. ANC 3882]MCH7312913.1 hypothetical protein [Acinetobacter sp. ANC 3882]